MFDYCLIRLLFKLLRNYSIFFFVGDVAYYVNDIWIDTEIKEVTMQYVERWDDDE